MRPEVLNPLFAEVEVLKGVGPQLAKALKRLDLTRAVDLLYHLPTGAIERVRAPAASAGLLGQVVIRELTPVELREPRSGRGPTRVHATDGDGNTISLLYFSNPGWAKKQLPLGETRTVFISGDGPAIVVMHEAPGLHPKVADFGRRVVRAGGLQAAAERHRFLDFQAAGRPGAQLRRDRGQLPVPHRARHRGSPVRSHPANQR